MKEYPIIPSSKNGLYLGLPCIAFDKLDGSNLRFSYTFKNKWHKFGTRTRLFDETDETFGEAIEIFKNKYAQKLEQTFKEEKNFRGAQEIICYCEFYGPNSFAGQHDIEHPALKCFGVTENNPKTVTLFDINIHKKGFLKPRDFINIFEDRDIEIPKVVYEGPLNKSLIENVKNNAYNLKEGVVCKGIHKNQIWMSKIKTNQYLEELKIRFTKDWENYI